MKYLFLILGLVVSLAVLAGPLPQCETSRLEEWKAYSEELISLRDYRFTNSHPRLRRLEEGVVRNALITKAYAGLYRAEKEQQGEHEISPYLWLPAAAYASFEVGQMIRHGYLTLKRKLKIQGTLAPRVYEENPLREIFIIGRLSLTGEQVAQNLANGNHGVYKDLFWQHLSSTKCGVETTIRLLVEHQGTLWSQKERDHFMALEKGWRLIAEGLKGMDRDLFLKGNLQLTYVEQKLVLQPLVYDGPLGQLGGTLFAQLAESPVKDENFSTLTFKEFCRIHRLLPNFSSFKNRWAWMTEQLEAMYDFFSGPYSPRVREHHLFFLSDSKGLMGTPEAPMVVGL